MSTTGKCSDCFRGSNQDKCEKDERTFAVKIRRNIDVRLFCLFYSLVFSMQKATLVPFLDNSENPCKG